MLGSGDINDQDNRRALVTLDLNGVSATVFALLGVFGWRWMGHYLNRAIWVRIVRSAMCAQMLLPDARALDCPDKNYVVFGGG